MRETNFDEELLKGFHTQFAENQRTREQSFLKIIGFLGTVVLGYAYIYLKFWTNTDIISFAAIASEVLLLAGASVVIVIAYSFRRDQFVNARIRKKAGIIGRNKAFPEEYNPSHLYKGENGTRRKRILLWMPDLFIIFFLIFPVFQIIILFSYFFKLGVSLNTSNPDTFVTITMTISLICIIFCFLILTYFSDKLARRLDKWETNLGNNRKKRIKKIHNY